MGALAVLLAIAAVAAVLIARGGGDADGAGAGGAPVRLQAIGSYDPQGDDGVEHPELVGNAVDGDPGTYWTTSTYFSDFSKEGVGVVLDAGRRVELSRIVVRTDTPGYTAEIMAGDSPTSFDRTVGESRTVGATTTFDLDGDAARYYVVWITDLERLAHITEVTARAA